MDLTDFDKEALSALLDNEASELEIRRLLKTLDSGPEPRRQALLDTWSRYHLARDMLHDEAVAVSADLSRQIETALADEPLPQSATSWRQSLVKLAIAASVAVVAVFSLQPGLQEPAGTAVVQEVAAPQAASAQVPTLIAESEPVEIDPVARQRLNDYLSAITVDVSDPLPIQNIQDSPLFQLVNELKTLP